ncbi:MAG: tail fiber domain-containing protein, partial [Anaerolineales bacterium]|nr:tail fiber domain-containing protein [Anaerolineales bacterium]
GGVAVDATAAEIDVLDGLDRGSIIYGNASSVTSILDQGNADEVLTSDGTDIAWAEAAGGGASDIDGLSDAVTTATSNVGLGSTALDSLTATEGNYNVAVGINAATALTTGDDNIAIGYGALDAADGAESDNIAIGTNAFGDLNNDSAVRNIGIGVGAGDGMGILASDDNIFIGYDTGGGTWATALSEMNIAIGNYSMDAAMNGARKNIALGHGTMTSLTTGDFNVAIGSRAGEDLTTASNNVFIGDDAGLQIVGGSGNVMIGTTAGNATTDVDNAVIIGQGAGAADMTSGADGTVAIGYQAGEDLTTAGGNLLIGSGAGKNMTDAYQNVCIGQDAGDALVSCDGSNSRSTNVLIGYKCTDNSTSGEVKKNVIIGANTSTNSTENVFIGSGVSDDTCSRSILIGHAINGGGGSNVYNISREGSPQGSNTIMLGNSDVDSSNGLYCYDTGISSPSDRRIKENIVDLDYGLDFVNLLRPRKFNKIKPTEYPEEILEEKYKQEDLEKRQYAIDTSTWVSKGTEEGLIAQEVKEAMESLGDIDFQGWQLGMNNTDQQTLSYVRFVIPLIKAVQELSEKNDELAAKVEALENE